jgi:hypothetical protein
MLYWLIYILLEAFIQYKSIKAGNKPSYLVLFLIRGIFSILQGGLILDVQYNTWQYPVLLGFQACSFWIVFDLVLNLLRKEKWDYKGSNSGYLDKIPSSYYLTLKFLVFIGAIYFYLEGLKFWNY